MVHYSTEPLGSELGFITWLNLDHFTLPVPGVRAPTVYSTVDDCCIVLKWCLTVKGFSAVSTSNLPEKKKAQDSIFINFSSDNSEKNLLGTVNHKIYWVWLPVQSNVGGWCIRSVNTAQHHKPPEKGFLWWHCNDCWVSCFVRTKLSSSGRLLMSFGDISLIWNHVYEFLLYASWWRSPVISPRFTTSHDHCLALKWASLYCHEHPTLCDLSIIQSTAFV